MWVCEWSEGCAVMNQRLIVDLTQWLSLCKPSDFWTTTGGIIKHTAGHSEHVEVRNDGKYCEFLFLLCQEGKKIRADREQQFNESWGFCTYVSFTLFITTFTVSCYCLDSGLVVTSSLLLNTFFLHWACFAERGSLLMSALCRLYCCIWLLEAASSHHLSQHVLKMIVCVKTLFVIKVQHFHIKIIVFQRKVFSRQES